MATFPGMRSRVVSVREMRETFGAEVKPFAPAFVIPRRYPGWEEAEPGWYEASAERTRSISPKTVRYIDVRSKA